MFGNSIILDTSAAPTNKGGDSWLSPLFRNPCLPKCFPHNIQYVLQINTGKYVTFTQRTKLLNGCENYYI